MKNLIITIISIFLVQFSYAQEPPLPPTPPSTSSSSSSSSTYSSSSSNSNEKTSISISYTEDDYKLRARFPKNRYSKLKNLIENTLGGKNMDIGKGYSKWSNDEKVYDVKLTEKNLRISLDLNVASPDLVEKFKGLGEDVKMIISGSNVNMERERVQREADRIRMEADRMKYEAKRLERQAKLESKRIEEQAKREIERAKRQEEREKQQLKREAKRIERDAKRIELEAKRLELEAKRIEQKARLKGGVSSYVKRLLDDPKTTYTATTSGANLNWIWPEVQENLLASLLEDKLISSTTEVTFTNENDRMHANGTELSETQRRKYNKMFRKAGIQSNADFSFYKKENHIVVIGLNAKIKKFFNDLYKKGYLTSTDDEVKLLIDGNSITQNGQRLATDKVAAYNAILRDNAIIPAPGKYIEMMKKGSYKLGYSLGPKSHIGTWIQED